MDAIDLFPIFGLFILLPVAAIVIPAIFVVAGVVGEASMSTEPRRGRWLPLVYYYLATIVGLSFLLVGLIGGLNGVVTAMFPRTADEYIYSEPPYDESGEPIEETSAEKAEREAEEFEQARNGGFAAGLRGLITAIVGAPVFFWHLRQARRREPEWLGAGPPKDAAA